MSLNVTSTIRNYLVNSSTLTAIVNDSSIRVGWTKIHDTFPCITLTQVGGSDYGYLGYGTTTAGSKLRREEVSIQLDIFSKTSRLETIQIADIIVPIMISGTCRKVSDIEMYDDEVGIYRKTQTYTKTKFQDD